MTHKPTSPTAIELLQSQSLTTLVQHEIERQIVAGTLTPGTKLNEIEVAGRLGVSRGPVREAFRALEEAGLLRTEKNRGVFVRVISLEEAEEIYTLRGVLDEYVGRTLAETITSEQLTRLRESVEAMHRAVVSGDSEAYYQLNVSFHDSLVEMVGSRKLLETYRRLVKELSLFRHEALTGDTTAPPKSAREHRDIVSAIASRDPERAAQVTREHLARGRARIRETLSRAPGAPAQTKAG
ncbi:MULTISPECIES: phosphonate utilization associated transcriptional regulator [Pandoraea]|uniref:GntR family transcriptional regulator n=1 Tax=Pandoraea communis TaxID=2508297 RepID=A0A5E4RYB3_9BURK|nr:MULTISPECIES: phosphonate utilization associated transcriptional regulator [Pandoraea]EON14533.1 GntR family transcriptional regulator [Pandoraea sp. SD6-2]VVD67424.1 GntR family transcriptional regulator [Pandoraea communis]